MSSASVSPTDLPVAAPARPPPPLSVPLLLRTGVALCFIGHGAYGVITKEAWLPYFAMVGINEAWSWQLMPWIGTMDIAIGFLALIWPARALFAWAAIWAVWTALCRPLAGQGWSEFFERAGNYGVPLAILAVVGLRAPWFSRLPEPWPGIDAPARSTRLAWALRISTFLLLAGHAGCAVFLEKPALAAHYAPFVSAAATHSVMLAIGYLEFAVAAAVLFLPSPWLLFGVATWKLATELLFLLSGTTAPMFEVIERGGSYIAPLTLGLLLLRTRPLARTAGRSARSAAC